MNDIEAIANIDEAIQKVTEVKAYLEGQPPPPPPPTGSTKVFESIETNTSFDGTRADLKGNVLNDELIRGYTIFSVIKPLNNIQTGFFLSKVGDTSTGDGNQRQIYCYYGKNKKIFVWICDLKALNWLSVNTTATFEPNTLLRIKINYDNTLPVESRFTISVNETIQQLQADSSKTNFNVEKGQAQLTIGGIGGVTGQKIGAYFYGNIYETVIYNHLATAAELNTKANELITKYP